jgi:hypothetical protein
VKLFELHSVSGHDNSIQGEPGLGAVPMDEVLDGKFIEASRFRRRQTIQYSRLGMLKVRQAQSGFSGPAT